MNRLKRSCLLIDTPESPPRVVCVPSVPSVPAEDGSWSHVCKPKSWTDLQEFAPCVTLDMQNGRRCYNGLVQAMACIESQRFVVLQGPPGTGKTTMLQLYAKHKGMACELVHPDDDDDLRDILKGAKDAGLMPTPTLWVFEHFDSMSKAARRAILQALPLSGPAVATAWPTDENMSDIPVTWFVMDPWDHASRVQFMMRFATVPVDADAVSTYLLASGGDICGAWNIARVCVTGTPTLRAPPSNLRTLVDASLTRSVTRDQLDMLNDCDEDTCLALLQESLPFACLASSLASFVNAYDALSACDASARYSGMVKGAFVSGALQATMDKPSTYSSGISFSAPKSTWSKFKGDNMGRAYRVARGMPAKVEDGGIDIDFRMDVLGAWGEDNTLVAHAQGNTDKPAKKPNKPKVKK